MKKLIFMFSVLFGTMIVSCGSAESVETVNDTVITVDTIAIDTIQ